MSAKKATGDTPTDEGFDDWAILELMGHRRLGGKVRAATIAGAPFIRIDVPSADGKKTATQFYSPASVYCLTPTTEDVARALAQREQPSPVHRFELPGPTRAEDMFEGRDRDDVDDADRP